MRVCKIKDCPSDNKCATCPYNDECDYVWVSNIWKKNSKLLTPLNPGWVKPDFRAGHIITESGKFDFCIFNNPKNKDTITIQDICVDEQGRGQGIAKKLLNDLMEKFDKDIIAKCIKGTSAESFWKHIGEKLYEEPSKQSILCVYKVKNKNKKQSKIELF